MDKKERDFEHDDISPKLLGAAARELMEELRFDLRAQLDSGKALSVRHLGQAITPDFNPYRFEAQYLLIEMSEKPEFVLDKNEIKEGFWSTPKQMRSRFEEGDLIVIPPMWKIMDALAHELTTKMEFDLITPEDEVPCLESIFGVKQFMPLSNTLPPAQRTNAFLIGDVLVDPSPKDALEYKKLFNSLPVNAVRKILITHHHGDHHQMAQDLAKDLDASVLLSEYTLGRILEDHGQKHFEGVQVKTVSDGDAVGEWLGEKVFVHGIPGHDAGQIALAPESLRWFIAGDLFQGVGTVVIGGREGNMKTYFETLQRVIDLSPRALYPSHGIVLGGANILEKTLEHRKLREAQVKSLRDEGLSPEEMLDRIYFDIPDSLRKYALANIRSHLEKLESERL